VYPCFLPTQIYHSKNRQIVVNRLVFLKKDEAGGHIKSHLLIEKALPFNQRISKKRKKYSKHILLSRKLKNYYLVIKTHLASSSYLIKLLPLLGKIYISSNYICFKSVLVGPRAKVVIPVKDIFSLEKGKRYTRFYYGIIITTIDQEEIRFDFHSTEARENCIQILDTIRSLPQIDVDVTSEMSNASIMKNIVHKETHLKYTLSRDQLEKIQPLGISNVEPPRKMHITCLTIGTRGDVQPYIALCKELMKDGHTCRIATHAEYKKWIESFGIEFSVVEGNPAELMQLCVDHGKINVGFLREAISKFLGWIDDLLESCRLACEGTDLLIESPTAFGGVHVAEALQIPFFSAFPMPWSRTRSYPHPFGVSDRSMGGTYNYMSYALIEQVLHQAMLSIVNKWRKSKLHLKPLGITLEDKKIPFLYSFSPSVVPHPPDWPDWIHVCGYWFLDNPDVSWTPPESLKKFLLDGPPPVYIGFGSIIVPDPGISY
jgi:sterol 3beta-glucosyltransferase